MFNGNVFLVLVWGNVELRVFWLGFKEGDVYRLFREGVFWYLKGDNDELEIFWLDFSEGDV